MEDAKTPSVRMWCCLDDLGSQVRNAFDSFVVRAPKITLLASKTARRSSSTYTPAAHISAGGSSLAISSEPSAPSSSATARDQLTKDNTRRLRSLHPLPPIAEEEDPAKIPVRAVILALRRAVSLVERAQNMRGGWGVDGYRSSAPWADDGFRARGADPEPISLTIRRRDSRSFRESRFNLHKDAFLTNAVEQAPGWISSDDGQPKEGRGFPVVTALRRKVVSSDSFRHREGAAFVVQRRSNSL